MSQSDITVLSITPATQQGNLRAFSKVKIGEITVNDCRIIQQPGSRPYVSGPQKQVGDRWYPLVSMSGSLRARVQEAVLAVAKKYGLVDEI